MTLELFRDRYVTGLKLDMVAIHSMLSSEMKKFHLLETKRTQYLKI